MKTAKQVQLIISGYPQVLEKKIRRSQLCFICCHVGFGSCEQGPKTQRLMPRNAWKLCFTQSNHLARKKFQKSSGVGHG
jgi:hypothetical protein